MKYLLLALVCCSCSVWPFAKRVGEDIADGEIDRAEGKKIEISQVKK